MEPIVYVVCNDENEPVLGDRFFVAQNVSANPDSDGRKPDAAEWPTGYVSVER